MDNGQVKRDKCWSFGISFVINPFSVCRNIGKKKQHKDLFLRTYNQKYISTTTMIHKIYKNLLYFIWVKEDTRKGHSVGNFDDDLVSIYFVYKFILW